MKFIEFFNAIDDIKNVRILTLENIPADTRAKQITFFHYIKAISLLDTIQILCRENKANESGIILRSLLNLYINIKWLTLKDINYRMKRYADFEIISKKIKMALADAKPDDELEKDKSVELNKKFNEIVAKYKLNAQNWKDLTRWSGKSIREMARDVCLLNDYEKIYSYLSFEEHTDPSTVRNHIDRSASVIFPKIANPDDFRIALIIWTALSYYYEIEKIISNIFMVSFSEEHPNLKELANKYLNEARKGNIK
ncbi:MAG: DUF5677 domain-containing protein [Candidatus Omnitrophota bacterium]